MEFLPEALKVLLNPGTCWSWSDYHQLQTAMIFRDGIKVGILKKLSESLPNRKARFGLGLDFHQQLLLCSHYRNIDIIIFQSDVPLTNRVEIRGQSGLSEALIEAGLGDGPL